MFIIFEGGNTGQVPNGEDMDAIIKLMVSTGW